MDEALRQSSAARAPSLTPAASRPCSRWYAPRARRDFPATGWSGSPARRPGRSGYQPRRSTPLEFSKAYDYSQTIVAEGPMVYVSGQGGFGADGSVVDSTGFESHAAGLQQRACGRGQRRVTPDDREDDRVPPGVRLQGVRAGAGRSAVRPTPHPQRSWPADSCSRACWSRWTRRRVGEPRA